MPSRRHLTGAEGTPEASQAASQVMSHDVIQETNALKQCRDEQASL